MSVASVEPRLTAAEWARMMAQPLRDKSYRLTRPGTAVTAYLAWKQNEDGAADRTLDSYERDLAYLCTLHPATAAAELTTDDYRLAINAVPAGSRHRRTAVYKDFSRWLYQESHADSDPMGRVRYPKRKPQAYIDVFTDAEREALLSLPIRDGALMALLLGAGLRKGEARNLRLRHVKVDTSEVVVLEGKGAKDRVVPVAPRVIQAVNDLALLEGLNPDDYLWYGVKGNAYGQWVRRARPVGEGTFHRWWGVCIEAAGVPYRNPHVARHTFATRWLRRTGRMETLSKAMGHTSIRTTVDLYGHLDVSDVARDLAIVEAFEG